VISSDPFPSRSSTISSRSRRCSAFSGSGPQSSMMSRRVRSRLLIRRASRPRHEPSRGRRTGGAPADRGRRTHHGRLYGPVRRQAMICPRRSDPRHTALKQQFDVLIHYPHHPCAGNVSLWCGQCSTRALCISSSIWPTAPALAAGMDDRTECGKPSVRRSCNVITLSTTGYPRDDRRLASILCALQWNAWERQVCRRDSRISNRTFYIG